MPTSNTEELGRFLKCTVIGRGVFGPFRSLSREEEHWFNIVQKQRLRDVSHRYTCFKAWF